MNRREFLGTMAAAPLVMHAQTLMGRRTFEITTRVDLPETRGRAMLWIPMPLGVTRPVPYQDWANARHSSAGNNTVQSRLQHTGGDFASVATAEWAEPAPSPWFSVTYRVTTAHHRVVLDASKPRSEEHTSELQS